MHDEEAIVELTRRYFAATACDDPGLLLVVGLTVKEAKSGLEGANDNLVEEDGYWLAPSTGARRGIALPHLLPFDEYSVAYRDRSAIIDPALPGWLQTGAYSLRLLLLGVRCWGRGNVVLWEAAYLST